MEQDNESKRQKNIRMRIHCLNEILNTEETYFDKLKFLVTVSFYIFFE